MVNITLLQHFIRALNVHVPCCGVIWLSLREAEERPCPRVEGYLPLFSWNVIPSHYWPVLTLPLRNPPFLLTMLIFAMLSTGVQTTHCLEEKGEAWVLARKERCHFHGCAWLSYSWGALFGWRPWARHTFPAIQISWVVKKKRWKGVEGEEGGASAE